MAIATTEASLLRLLQLSSVSLPVGGYAFSQGMEYAVDHGWIRNKTDVFDWLNTQLQQSLARVDLPLLRFCMAAAKASNTTKLIELNDLLLACRETKELRLTDTAMGQALLSLMGRLFGQLPEQLLGQAKGEEVSDSISYSMSNSSFSASSHSLSNLSSVNTLLEQKALEQKILEQQEEVSFVTVFAVAATRWHIDLHSAALGFTWSWLENQVAAATKLVPLGQTQAQELLGELQVSITDAIHFSHTLTEDEVGAGLPALAIASALHETQYSRLFRS
ncbi:urease accessory protein UreF [Marinomonas agarivorans]|nr:urease accessory protein UreF [Marinomonas agarivorans]